MFHKVVYVATYARCGGIFNIHLTTNLSRNLPAIFLNWLTFDRIVVMDISLEITIHPLELRPILWKNFATGQPSQVST